MLVTPYRRHAVRVSRWRLLRLALSPKRRAVADLTVWTVLPGYSETGWVYGGPGEPFIRFYVRDEQSPNQP